MKNNLVIIQRIFPHYRQEIFDKIFERHPFVLLHTSLNSSVKQTHTHYSKYISYFQYGNSETKLILNPFLYLILKRPKNLVHEFSIGILSLLPTIFFAKLLGTKIILWGHGYDRNKGFDPLNCKSDKFRLWLMKYADAVLLYGREAKKELVQYLDADKIFVAQNTLNTEKLIQLKNAFEMVSKEKIKQDLALTRKKNITFIGRLLEDKKPELCIDLIADYVHTISDDIMLHFIGDGALMNSLKHLVENKGLDQFVKFYGAVYDDILTGQILYCSDLMIMPGYLGLSVNHAFCFECPIVSFAQGKDGPFHSPEIEYVVQNETGYLADSYEDMKAFVIKYLNDQNMQNTFKKNINYCVENVCSISNMVDGIEEAIKFCEALV